MKIKQLHISNIASIVEATIDFTAQPLCDSDVYLITGDTGAGKTTILDAICLALFNNTPRLAKGTKVTVKNGDDELTLRDPRRLMRRNTGEALVELLFEGNDGTDYKAEWQVQRGKKKKVDNKLNSINRSITNLATGESIQSAGVKDAELQAKIAEVIGLDFDQFCRTTMLAQNEFTKFLSSGETERSDILEKITQTSEFSAVGSKVFEIQSVKKEAWEAAQKAASDTGLTDDEIAEKKEQVASLEENKKQQSAKRDNARKKRDWLETENKLAQKEAQTKQEFDAASEVLESEQYKSDCSFVNDWNATIGARKHLEQAVAAEKQIKQQEGELSKLKAEYVKVRSGYQYAQNECEESCAKLKVLDEAIAANSGKVAVFDNAQTIGASLTTIAVKSKKVEELVAAVEKEQQLLTSTLVPQCEKANGEFAEHGKAVQVLADAIKTKDSELDALKLKDLRNERDTVKELLSNIGIAIDNIDAINKAEEARNKEKQRLDALKNDIEARKLRLDTELVPCYTEAKAATATCEQARDLLRDSVDSFAKQMRSRLTVGCECPVCRQKVQQLPLEDAVNKMYLDADQSYNEAKSKCELAEKQMHKAESELKSETKRYDTDKKKYDADHSVTDAQKKAAESCKKCGIDALNADTKQALQSLHDAQQKHLTTDIGPKITNGEKLEEELKGLRTEHETATKTLEQMRVASEKAKQAVDGSKAKIENNNRAIAEHRADIATAIGEVEPLLADSEWEHDWKSEPLLFKKELEQAAADFASKKSQKADLDAQIAQAQRDNECTANIIKQIQGKQAYWSKTEPVAACQMANLFESANSVLQRVGVVASAIASAQSTATENRNNLNQFLEQHPDLTIDRLEYLNAATSVSKLAEKIENQRKAPTQKETLWKEAIESHKAHQAAKPELAEDDTIDSTANACQVAENAIGELNQQIGAINKELNADAEKKKALTALVEKETEARKEYDKWLRLSKLIGDKDGKVFRTIAQSYIFGGLLNSANTYLEKLEPRYSLKSVPRTLYSSLEDAYQGYASRDTSSLSGGESFLVSLALALALSDIGQGLSVDTLFIDEGFGSLSGQPLTNAINTLRSLRGKNGRHVGIISHIQEVRDNIPVQIQVVKSSDSSSSTIQVTE